MIKGIIFLHGSTNRRYGSRLGEFYWMDEHEAHVYLGRELSLEEFNNAWPLVARRYEDYLDSHPITPRLVEVMDQPEAEPEPEVEKPAAKKAAKRKKSSDRVRVKAGLAS